MTNAELTMAILYEIPIIANLIIQIFVVRKIYKKEVEARDLREEEGIPYFPNLTFGEVVTRLLFSFVPVVNLFILVGYFIDNLDKPLVPDRKKVKQ